MNYCLIFKGLWVNLSKVSIRTYDQIPIGKTRLVLLFAH